FSTQSGAMRTSALIEEARVPEVPRLRGSRGPRSVAYPAARFRCAALKAGGCQSRREVTRLDEEAPIGHPARPNFDWAAIGIDSKIQRVVGLVVLTLGTEAAGATYEQSLQAKRGYDRSTAP